jgi:hypothetical protein
MTATGEYVFIVHTYIHIENWVSQTGIDRGAQVREGLLAREGV